MLSNIFREIFFFVVKFGYLNKRNLSRRFLKLFFSNVISIDNLLHNLLKSNFFIAALGKKAQQAPLKKQVS